jgi:Pentapeptide repeats (8 copies)
MELKQKIDRLWNKVQPLIIPAVILLIIIAGTLFWKFQQNNVDSLQHKIENFRTEILQSSPSNEKLTLEGRLKLEKDILVIEKDKTTIQNGVYTTLVQALGGVILGITAYVGYRNLKNGEETLKIGQKNLEVTEDKQVTERFSKSIEHLGSDKIDVRLGGIYALEQIAFDSAKYHWTIVEILSAFIREKSRSNRADSVGVDIQAALAVIGRRKQYPNDKVIDLRKISLVGVELQNTNFSKADFSGTNLSNANLSGANLSEANLSLTHLIGADLSNANLNGADLNNTHLDDSPQPYEYEYPEDPRYIIPPDYDSTAANLNGADLSTCKNLTQSQLIFVAKNENTKLPDYLNIPIE